jgi:hypothetical protein
MSVDEYQQRVKKKYLPTLTLLNEKDFEKGLEDFRTGDEEKVWKSDEEDFVVCYYNRAKVACFSSIMLLFI